MNADPVPPAIAGTPEDWRPLPVAARTVAMITGALYVLPVAIGTAVLAPVLLRLLPGSGLAAGALALVLAVAGALVGRARWRRTTWRLDARGLQVRRGLLWRKEILVPRSRVQHLDLERGPLERRFGLATLVVHTAGTRLSALRQSGFVDADAVALRDALLPEAGHDDDDL